LTLPDKEGLLLHVCCAPDATIPWPALVGEGFEVCGFFYGDNIHPQSEWLLRKEAVISLARILNARVETGEYDPRRWLEKVSHLKDRPEGGERCELCFELQLLASAEFAVRIGFRYLTTTLTISPHKDPELINGIGSRICADRGLEWAPKVWRKNDGFRLSVARSREFGLYRQNYCGCTYSIRTGR
jgi:predicted adenine nucleotide alpha hydrolase (AANH) superfamily ATPase